MIRWTPARRRRWAKPVAQVSRWAGRPWRGGKGGWGEALRISRFLLTQPLIGSTAPVTLYDFVQDLVDRVLRHENLQVQGVCGPHLAVTNLRLQTWVNATALAARQRHAAGVLRAPHRVPLLFPGVVGHRGDLAEAGETAAVPKTVMSPPVAAGNSAPRMTTRPGMVVIASKSWWARSRAPLAGGGRRRGSTTHADRPTRLRSFPLLHTADRIWGINWSPTQRRCRR